MFDSSYLDLMPHTINRMPFDYVVAWGNKIYASGTYPSGQDLQARVTNKVQRIIGRDGQEVVSNTEIWVAYTGLMVPEDLITLPAGFEPQTPTIIRVNRISDEDGFHHTKLYA